MTFPRFLKELLTLPFSPAAVRLLFALSPPGEAQAPRSVLVVKLDAIGDSVLNSPFLRGLRQRYPVARITLVVNPSVYNLVELCPYVDEVLAFDGACHPRIAPAVRPLRAFRFAREKLWERRFDLAVIPRLDTDFYHATYLAYFSRATRRVAFSEKTGPLKARKNRDYDLLLTDVVVSPPGAHDVIVNLSLLEALPAGAGACSGEGGGEARLEVWLSEEDRARAASLLGNRGVVALAPGASASHKQWPVERFAEVATWCLERYGVTSVVVGGPSEREIGATLCSLVGPHRCLDLTGKTSLRETAAVLERCALYIGNDTGPKHLAAATGTKVVEISCFPAGGDPRHPQSPARFRAWGTSEVTLQPSRPADGCGDACLAAKAHCILGVEVREVQQAVLDLEKTDEDKSVQPAMCESLPICPVS
ncbi:glycosyltransferase family 9 protein [Geomonas sp. Red32]|uniref:glycosyltransferase family 9 protein n=1 Tax=Geomonas sp. Red32 TaxID=2912856 RepID=UPI00202CD2E6|nr:glycosyltransferase family 9 protein [Geomonas sp. Red32]MCM0081370.1 glycosyltransferase family 9 protein [Geomonas sp. Red32]